MIGPVLRVAVKVVGAVVLLLGLTLVGVQIDLLPYLGSGRFDYFPHGFLTAPHAAFYNVFLPPLLVGLVLSVFGGAAVWGRFPKSAPVTLLKAWAAWFLAAAVLVGLAEARWWWPLSYGEAGWVVRYAARCAATAATLLTAAQWLLGRYAGWRARPKSRWVEVGLWFAVTAVLTIGFKVVVSLFGGLSSERLAFEIMQEAVIFGGLLSLAVALAPRSSPVGPEGLEPPTRPL